MEDFLIAYYMAGTVLGTAELRLRRTSFWAQRLVWWGDSSEEDPPLSSWNLTRSGSQWEEAGRSQLVCPSVWNASLPLVHSILPLMSPLESTTLLLRRTILPFTFDAVLSGPGNLGLLDNRSPSLRLTWA